MFSKQYLLQKLKENGLPYTYLSLMVYEKKGIIPKPQRLIGSNHRYYTQDQIEEVVSLVKQYRHATSKT